ncbi:magnesium transporter CorA family protein [Staphylococcus intermedius]|uniref:Transporter, CorA family n=1 Tax=Staphylococcus intermedius NCTC 11048 TaxID=1141106 RepID=A0A380G6H0_STAIN|nr:magnesium transporter CorA family protein [Staphylococcus intermedius]PCF63825.1 magnesium transporter CorA [Staphylococcus intermedius]PCF78540.1 magnesium transporter CorA [Staphylococcus intermedius]PCF79513.1 magnesium transporter CorA [Staphylococcus intermedius]PCF86751.1 magnesium transporter CorA [Staphylococcus intermedius]PNZ52000.1 magnesium transporter CorA family protein [Staphylococcus intermedius NCTC 11048]
MIHAYRNDTDLRVIESEDWEHAQWLNVVKPTPDELERLIEVYGFPQDFLEDALDSEESSRIEYDDDSDYSLIISDFPFSKSGQYKLKSFTTLPLGIIIGKDIIVTVCAKPFPYFDHLMQKPINLKYKSQFALKVMYDMAAQYNRSLRLLNKERRQVEYNLQQRVTNQRLFLLSEIEKSLVYFLGSLKTNSSTIRYLFRLPAIKRFDEDEELLEDLQNEHQQAVETTELYLRIVESMSNSYASLLSNQLNTTMKTLTIFTVLLTLPTLVFSFFGMNVPLPIDTGSAFSWLIIIVLSMLLVVVLFVFLWRNDKL